MGKNKHNKGWNGQRLQRDSLREAGVRRGFFLIALVTLFLVGGFIGGSVGVYHWLCRSDFFQMTAIDVEGNQDLSKNTIIFLAGIDIHANLLAVDTAAVEARICKNGWIESASLHKEWPSRLRIEVKERRAVALLNTSQGLYYVDGKGQPFAPLTEQDELDFPVISGLESSLTFQGTEVVVAAREELDAVLKFIGWATRGSSSLPAQNISEVSFTSDREVVLFLADRPFPIFLGKEVGKKEYNRLAKVLYWLYKKKEFQSVAYIRLDYMENKVLVGTEMAKDKS
ncbi:MAG: FtsQ-type POTRA domain-containing protein [Proteobacteria bacterium]|nr:FtsQ-type POTRA domain-containing protein [Desulfobulbaceae bacterium]MBU4151568.1 FtsQ-type POTRA domain-containing protein [Pseudomonadota bacterium]MDP2105225.1 FtsQ-type POTRA domain-containing protein [Desulfobulbaceae bacterium]